jgi:hypothetical protein
LPQIFLFDRTEFPGIVEGFSEKIIEAKCHAAFAPGCILTTGVIALARLHTNGRQGRACR